MGVKGQGKQTFTVEDVKWLSLWQVRVSEKIRSGRGPGLGGEAESVQDRVESRHSWHREQSEQRPSAGGKRGTALGTRK